MNRKIRISAVQMDMLFENPEQNYSHAEKLIEKAATEEKPDVIVLPETWNTGFFPHTDLEKLSDKNAEKTKALLSRLSSRFGVYIVGGSVAQEVNSEIYNTSFVFSPKGELLSEYSKTHLFTPMNEHKFFTAGNSLSYFEIDSVKCAVIICYDIRFPELARTLALNGIEILFVVSQWPAVRNEHLKILSCARAVENQMFTVVCNSCGTAGETVYGGMSRVIDPWGSIISQADNEEEIITADLDMSVIDGIRSSINVFNDRKEQLYKIN